MTLSKYIKDLTGQVYGHWTVVSFHGQNDRKKSIWNCKCECGVCRPVLARSLSNGSSKSCGCLRDELVSERFYIHGESNSKIHEAWKSMMGRCYNNKTTSYKWYGARGIKVCDRWQDFAGFHADNKLYENTDLTLDRQDNDGDYCPENCRWVDMKTQQNNRRDTLKMTHEGQTLSLKQWAEAKGINYQTLYHRVVYAKKPLAESLGVPV